MPTANQITMVPVVVDNDKCIADKGCRTCIDVCPLDVLWIDEKTGKDFGAETKRFKRFGFGFGFFFVAGGVFELGGSER